VRTIEDIGHLGGVVEDRVIEKREWNQVEWNKGTFSIVEAVLTMRIAIALGCESNRKRVVFVANPASIIVP
jgi:hypothetical protein